MMMMMHDSAHVAGGGGIGLKGKQYFMPFRHNTVIYETVSK